MAAWVQTHALSLMLWLPTAGALLLLLLPGRKPRFYQVFGLVVSLLPLAFTIALWTRFDLSLAGGGHYQFEEIGSWYAAVGASYHLGVDGISWPMVTLTAFLTPLAFLASFNIERQMRTYVMLFLLLETGLLGVFLSLDLLLFFVFWEVGLVPMYFIINLWGGEKRNYASLKFLLFTMGGSLGLLLAILLMGTLTGSYDLPVLMRSWVNLREGSLLGLPVETVKAIAFWAFFIAFAIKVPIWPFHTWLPDAHTEAPTAGSMLLAGVLLKLGAYGFLRLILPLFPDQAHTYSGVMAGLATAAIVFGALGAFGQSDFKRLVAYSSINHMGFVILAVAAAAWTTNPVDQTFALNGAVLQMFNHGVSSAGMFFLVGVLYDQAHTRNLNDFGGLYAQLPVYGGILLFTVMGSLGLPGLGGFISEFLVVRGAWPVFTVDTAISMIGLFFTGAYMLKAVRQVLHGPLNERWRGKLTDISPRQVAVMVPLMGGMLALGVWPALLLNVINQAVTLGL
jgi:NADH-quinone oxidoreductase subunit M